MQLPASGKISAKLRPVIPTFSFLVERGKHALAGIISSSTLSSTGAATGSEAKIRRKVFSTQIVKALVEQPNAMFTNTKNGTQE